MALASQTSYNGSFRVRRKWPSSFYKSRWQQDFELKQAMETLKKAIIEKERPSKTHLLSILIDSFHSYGCEPNPAAYSFIIKDLFQRSLISHIPPILDHLEKSEKFKTPEKLFIHLIRNYGEIGMLQDAVDLFFRIPKFRCEPSIFSLNALLHVLCKHREGLALVRDVLIRSLDMNICLESSSFHILVKALCKIGRIDYSMELINMMELFRCSPNSRIYSTVLSSLCKHSSSIEVMKFLEEMHKAGFIPCRNRYANVIDVLVKEAKPKDAMNILKQMNLEGMQPDLVSYTNVLNGLFSTGEFELGDELFDDILVMGLVPDNYTYSVYINGLCKWNKFDEALIMLVCMEQAGCKPDVITYNTIMTGFCKAKKLEGATEIMKMMKLKGVNGNLHTYRILLDSLICNNEIEEAIIILIEMLDRGFLPRILTINTLICKLCNNGHLHEALHVLDQIIKGSLGLGGDGWNALLLCLRLDSCDGKVLTKLDNLILSNSS